MGSKRPDPVELQRELNGRSVVGRLHYQFLECLVAELDSRGVPTQPIPWGDTCWNLHRDYDSWLTNDLILQITEDKPDEVRVHPPLPRYPVVYFRLSTPGVFAQILEKIIQFHGQEVHSREDTLSAEQALREDDELEEESHDWV